MAPAHVKLRGMGNGDWGGDAAGRGVYISTESWVTEEQHNLGTNIVLERDFGMKWGFITRMMATRNGAGLVGGEVREEAGNWKAMLCYVLCGQTPLARFWLFSHSQLFFFRRRRVS